MNIGIEQFLAKVTKGDDALLMIAAFILLMAMCFIVEMWVEIKSKDLKWNDVTRFLNPILFNGIFLLALEIAAIPANRLPFGGDIVNGIQYAGWLGFMGYYILELYKNLKTLGLKTSKKVDEAMEKLEHKEEE